MRAWSLIRTQPHYRHDAFISGLRAAGFDVRESAPSGAVSKGDVLCIWNRYGHVEQIADAFERDGGTVLVAENGYVRGRHDGGDYYALAVHGHNGAGRWYAGGPERWAALGVKRKPLRKYGRHILVAANRSFGMCGTVMPKQWGEQTAAQLSKITDRPIRLRLHPGNNKPSVPLKDDIEGAHCVVIWSSSVGIQALLEGVPVVCCAPYWIMKGIPGVAATEWVESDIHFVESGRLGNQPLYEAFERLAWAQWSVEEIARGEAFDYVLRAA